MSDFYDYRLKFSKNGPIRFVGHLDVMRYIQKANRRAALPMRYSEGFSPHQILSFALPLSVGATSDGEYLDMSLTAPVEPAEIVARLNAVMHEGIGALACVRLAEHAPKAMTAVAAADYSLRVRDEALGTFAGAEGARDIRTARAALAEALRVYLSKEAILVTKKTKKGAQEVDIRPLVHRWDVADDGTLRALLHAGSKDHVKPALLYEAFYADRGETFAPQMLTVHRHDLFEERDGAFAPLIASSSPKNIGLSDKGVL